jgi:hypothetical protein
MRVLVALVVILFSASNVLAVAPQFWRVRGPEDLLSGEIEGFTITSRGQMRPAPAVKKLGTFTDPFVLSQVTAPSGDNFFGTGNDGKVYRLRGGELKALATLSEPEIYALAFRSGALYAGTSPNGKVYRIDPDSGASKLFYDPQQAYIWALEFLPGGDLLVATGVEGRLMRVSPAGQGKVWFDAPETHIRSMAIRGDGSVLLGGSGQGRIYNVAADGAAHALYDSSLSEISALYIDRDGVAWAAGASNILPSSAPPKSQGKPQQQQSNQSSEQRKENEGASSANVEVTFSFDDGPSLSQGGSAELYKINADGFVESMRKFERELVYAISGAPDGGILLSTGPQGRIYQYRDGETALVASIPEKQVVSISNSGGRSLITTTNSGAVYRLENGPSPTAEFRSVAKDVERFSKFGHYRIEGNNIGDGRLAISFRSGNTQTPDGTWSSWSKPSTETEGNIAVPSGRYIQWKLTMPKPEANLTVEGVTIAFINRNIAPTIDVVTVQEPAVVFISSSYPAAPQVVEATNPDEYGIFSSLDNPRDKNEQGKRVFRKGYRTITWRAHDDNGDAIRYSLSFRRKGSERWLRLRENIDETQVNFDTSQLPDGTYQLRLTASDVVDNPENALTDVREGVEFQVDNTPPTVTVAVTGNDAIVTINDKLSPIGKVEYSLDAQKWVRLTPADGIADSPNESYRLSRSTLEGRFVIIRAVDAYYNVATESISVPDGTRVSSRE